MLQGMVGGTVDLFIPKIISILLIRIGKIFLLSIGAEEREASDIVDRQFEEALPKI